MTSYNYCPPDTDSESDYDGFYFDDYDMEKKKRPAPKIEDPEQGLYDAVTLGNLEELKKALEKTKLPINNPIKRGFTLLLHACGNGHVEIVRFLLEEKEANVNKQVDSYTPLMQACGCEKDSNIVLQIVRMLLNHGSVVNVSDKYGVTPFMLACKNGHTSTVELLIKQVSFDAFDNQGCTPIFHAIENNHADIVKILIAAGVNINIANNKGYTPRQVIQFHGFYDLMDLLPKEKESYLVSTKYLSYTTLRDYIPRIFLKSDCPEYFQEINIILLSLNMERFLEYFDKAHCSFEQFLVMDDVRLKQIGFIYPIYQMKLQKGLLDFHLHHWSNKTIARVNKQSEDNFYNILMITANQFQQLVIIKASLQFVSNNLRKDRFGCLLSHQSARMLSKLKTYHLTIKDLQKTTLNLASASPRQNPLYIDYDDYLISKKRRKIKRCMQYTTLVLGFSVFVCLKLKNFL